MGALAGFLRPAPDSGLGKQRRPGAERARQPRRQRRPDQRARRPRLLHASLRARRWRSCGAPARRFHAKEQELEQQLHDTEEKLTALQAKGGEKQGGALLLTPNRSKEIEHFQTEKLRIRKELRAVRAGLDREHQDPRPALKIINIIAVPALLAALALLIGAGGAGRAAPGLLPGRAFT